MSQVNILSNILSNVHSNVHSNIHSNLHSNIHSNFHSSSDVVGPEGMVYAVEFSHRSGRDLINMAKKRTNVVPIIEDARHPHR